MNNTLIYYETILNTLDEVLDIEISETSLSTSLEDLGIDKIAFVELIMKLEGKLNFRADEGLYELETLDELINQIKKYKLIIS